MKPSLACSAALAGLILLAAPVSTARAGAALIDLEARKRAALTPAAVDTSPVLFLQRDLSGPRVGFTFAPSDGDVYRTLRDNGMGRVISQFGWHFEHQLAPASGGPQLLTQFVPLFGGVEYGKLVPSLTMAMGMRLPSGVEFGVGPSFTLVNAEGRSGSALVIAVGKTMNYSGVSIPINVALATNQKGVRVTALAGYAIQRAVR